MAKVLEKLRPSKSSGGEKKRMSLSERRREKKDLFSNKDFSRRATERVRRLSRTGDAGTLASQLQSLRDQFEDRTKKLDPVKSRSRMEKFRDWARNPYRVDKRFEKIEAKHEDRSVLRGTDRSRALKLRDYVMHPTLSGRAEHVADRNTRIDTLERAGVDIEDPRKLNVERQINRAIRDVVAPEDEPKTDAPDNSSKPDTSDDNNSNPDTKENNPNPETDDSSKQGLENEAQERIEAMQQQMAEMQQQMERLREMAARGNSGTEDWRRSEMFLREITNLTEALNRFVGSVTGE